MPAPTQGAGTPRWWRWRPLTTFIEFADEHAITEQVSDDYKSMLVQEKLDLVSICVPNFLHYQVAMDCAASGVHAISEKPLATKLEHGAAMVKKFKEKGLKLFYAEDWLFAPAIKRAMEIVKEGATGGHLLHQGEGDPQRLALAVCREALHLRGWRHDTSGCPSRRIHHACFRDPRLAK
ncbi:MAG: Gfo/Idh/MocA family oxidoreductase [Desulfomicrobium escambiense]|nr:Gfo/Idh/MocA family oxidoreductase [Desulfomicrobium escambiense]